MFFSVYSFSLLQCCGSRCCLRDFDGSNDCQSGELANISVRGNGFGASKMFLCEILNANLFTYDIVNPKRLHNQSTIVIRFLCLKSSDLEIVGRKRISCAGMWTTIVAHNFCTTNKMFWQFDSKILCSLSSFKSRTDPCSHQGLSDDKVEWDPRPQKYCTISNKRKADWILYHRALIETVTPLRWSENMRFLSKLELGI